MEVYVWIVYVLDGNGNKKVNRVFATERSALSYINDRHDPEEYSVSQWSVTDYHHDLWRLQHGS